MGALIFCALESALMVFAIVFIGFFVFVVLSLGCLVGFVFLLVFSD